MYDPYSRDTPGLSDPASNLITLTPNDGEDIPLGVKALRIFNSNETVSTVHAVSVAGDTISFNIPPQTLWTEPLRIARLLTQTSSGLIIQGYTDRKAPE